MTQFKGASKQILQIFSSSILGDDEVLVEEDDDDDEEEALSDDSVLKVSVVLVFESNVFKAASCSFLNLAWSCLMLSIKYCIRLTSLAEEEDVEVEYEVELEDDGNVDEGNVSVWSLGAAPRVVAPLELGSGTSVPKEDDDWLVELDDVNEDVDENEGVEVDDDEKEEEERDVNEE
ncbi:hypothetical protein EDD11_005730 [Mortierella claussenii]|nr:hypothetical protein EDD11_005730 [Mortierella claussenii]